MANHRLKSCSGDKFSFPIIPIQDHDFEFGCATPGSPNSPADHLFFNGKLLPHAFPCQPTNNTMTSFSRSTSRTSSVSSKDSLTSSRSNSTNSSRSSSCSSARTSTSEAAAASPNSDRKLSSHHHQAKVAAKNPVEKDWYQGTKKPVLTPHYGSSQRWQFIAPAPDLKLQVSRARKAQSAVRDQEFKSKKQTQDSVNARTWFGLKFFRVFVSACKECHAIKPSSRKCLDNK